MKLVIDIPEDEYNECKMQVELMKQEGILIESLNTALRIFVANGTQLPKGHGRLIDANALRVSLVENEWITVDDGGGLEDLLDYAPTIIEADKAESEDKE